MTIVALDSSPTNVLRSMRGTIVAARLAHPEVLHVEIRDSVGELWKFTTQDAEWSPASPNALVGHAIEDAEIDSHTGTLRCRLSNGTSFDVTPAVQQGSDDPPNWELIAPDGLVLEFGPGMRWQISSADAHSEA